jgi:hypothetical protein
MKKIFLFAAAAALLTACSSEELAGVESAQQNAGEAPINFSVYTPRTITRAGAAGAITTADLKNAAKEIGKSGFGVLAYYTDDEKYDKENSKPDFMYNTQVTYNGGWVYNPVMYWPNEFGKAAGTEQGANSENIDYVSFFAYAPYIDVVNETGIPEVKTLTDAELVDFLKTLGIKYNQYTKVDVVNSATFATYKGVTFTDDAEYIAAYNADFDPDVATAADADAALAAKGLFYYNVTVKDVETIADYALYLTDQTGNTVSEAAAKEALIELNKDQIQGKNITSISKNTASGDPIVKYVVDANPATSVDLLWGVAAKNAATNYAPIVTGRATVNEAKPFVDLIKPADPANSKLSWNLLHALAKLNVTIKYIADAQTPNGATQPINQDETRIYVRWIKIGGFVMKGALNLNSTETEERIVGTETIKYGVPNWKGYDGNTALAYTTTTFNDGRKEGKEGTYNGQDKNEENAYLNPEIIENYSKAVWPAGKNAGVTGAAVNLFGGDPTLPIFVIPTKENIDIEICYDVETKDAALAGVLSDGVTAGSVISNTIRKTSDQIFTAATKMEPGKGYTINIILGMTSAKFEASVQPWDETPGEKPVDLPYNGVTP